MVSPPPSSKWTVWTVWFAQGLDHRQLSYVDPPRARQLLVWPRLARYHHLQLALRLTYGLDVTEYTAQLIDVKNGEENEENMFEPRNARETLHGSVGKNTAGDKTCR